ncbi:uncharacterized protein LOC112504744 [Cynara cardunculus var. scolymus]|uniref:uncharacterized protein LOC112504744 n=1 Tax=Cynara cardunculus var. scolymus TaxID=59895 RepID=UPI000D62D17D|nr:uncharacterized protein LOC112504744 [Cynara cardunculus var. scolymus]
MGASESTGRGEKEEETNTSAGGPNLGVVAVAIGSAAVAGWGVSRMLSDNRLEPPLSLPNSGGTTSSSAPPRRFKLNTDGACHPNHEYVDGVLRGPSGYAGILQDGCGNWVLGFRGFITWSDCFTAELHGILKGLELLDKLGYKESILESDSQAAVQWVTGEEDVGPGKSRVVGDCWELIKKSRHLVRKNGITIRRCSRDANKFADKLASVAI